MPKVSILVPIYNQEKYLKECLDSVINQTLKDIEIICINDGSTDNSAQILEEFASKDNRIKVITKENSGYGHSINIGLNNATGEYIGIVESDDFAKENMFEELYKIASSNDADMVKSDFYFYTTKNNQSRQAGVIKRQNIDKIMTIKDDLYMLKIQPSIWSAIYKREFLAQNNIRFLETKGASYQDTSFAFKVLSTATRLILTNKAYLYYRYDNDNSSVKSKKKVFAICDEWEEITKFLNERPEIKKLVNQVKLSTEFNAYKWNAIRIDAKYRDEFIDKYQETFKKYFNNKEIDNNFYVKVKSKDLDMLLNNKEQFKEYIKKLAQKQRTKEKRRKNWSIRINSSRVSIVVAGKQLVEIG